ncbi:MAG: hypothetical protein DWQ36_06280 [Acidobacteria bacterium]|nr:MAG: hypothetical protein DWQ30_19285 [Acidobacteriota bacterium]REK09652.1 MAG: hypothetical protein DWQ36_06280 [Acidobacteriota bacterium]
MSPVAGRRRATLATAAAALALALGALPASAQPVLEGTEELDFDRPEAWAMKFFSAASLLTSVGAAAEMQPGAVDLGFEVLTIPHLDEEQRTVGFNGIKEEDLNRSPVWARLRATVGLPHEFQLTVGWMPPVDIDGVEADLITVGLARRLLGGERWSLRGSLYAQHGDAQGDFTCPSGEEASAPGSPANPFGCEAPSSDTITLDYVGLELAAVRASPGGRVPTLHFGASVNELDLTFQTDARTFGFLDRTRLRADGQIYSFTSGATWELNRRAGFGVELFYSPLGVQRPGDMGAGDDPLLNLRAMLRYRVR